jgi:hypothetical protein
MISKKLALVREQLKKEEEARHKKEVAQLVAQVRELAARQEFLDKVKPFHRPPRILAGERTSGLREMTAVVLASDWHVEEPVEAESVAHCNEYNLTVADLRIRRFFNGIIWNIEHQRASKRLMIRDLVLWLGGDLITGFIHPELVESNELSPTVATRWIQTRLRDGLATLLERCKLDRIVVPCSYGNHGRTTEKRRVSTGYANSFEWLMYHNLSDAFTSDKRVQFEITNSPHQYVQVYDKILHFHHGDEVKYQGGVGGVAIPLLKRVASWDSVRTAHIHHVGHFHQLRDFGNAVVNGSLIGYGPFSQSIGARFELAQQGMYFIDSKMGRCQSTPLWVQKPSDIKKE